MTYLAGPRPEDQDHTGCRTNGEGACMGFHCGNCGKPSSQQGHYFREAYTKEDGSLGFRGEWKFRCPK